MLPTPDTSHVSYERVYEPAEDSFLFLDTLSSASETAFLRDHFSSSPSSPSSPSPPSPPSPLLVVEIGPGSGVVIAFANAHAGALFGTAPPRGVLTAAVDVNAHACRATGETVRKAAAAAAAASATGGRSGTGTWLGAARGDLAAPLRAGSVDVLLFNPPYVPTAEMPRPPAPAEDGGGHGGGSEREEQEREKEDEERGKTSPPPPSSSFDADSYLLALSYAGGRGGMETTDRLLADLPRVLSGRGCAYVLLCAQNRPEEVKRRIVRGEYWPGDEDRHRDRDQDRDRRGAAGGWRAETVGSSGKTAGWEKLQIIRIWREPIGEGRERGGGGGGGT